MITPAPPLPAWFTADWQAAIRKRLERDAEDAGQDRYGNLIDAADARGTFLQLIGEDSRYPYEEPHDEEDAILIGWMADQLEEFSQAVERDDPPTLYVDGFDAAWLMRQSQ